MKQAIVAAALCLMVWACAEKEPGDDRVIRVNGTWLKRDEVDRVADMLRYQLHTESPGASLFGGDDIRRSAARQLITNQLMLEEGRRLGIVVADSVVNRAFEDVKAKVGGEALEEGLKGTGRTEDDMREYVREGMVVDSLLKIVLAGADSLTEQVCRGYYDAHPERFREPGRIRASQIVLLCDSAAEQKVVDAKRTLAEGIRARLTAGGSFAALARKHSEGPNAASGGDVGWFSRGQLMPEIEETALALEKGQTSPVLRTAVGFHIIRKTGEEPEKPVPYEQVSNSIRVNLTIQRQSDTLLAYANRLIGAADVEYRDTTLAPRDGS